MKLHIWNMQKEIDSALDSHIKQYDQWPSTADKALRLKELKEQGDVTLSDLRSALEVTAEEYPFRMQICSECDQEKGYLLYLDHYDSDRCEPITICLDCLRVGVAMIEDAL